MNNCATCVYCPNWITDEDSNYGVEHGLCKYKVIAPASYVIINVRILKNKLPANCPTYKKKTKLQKTE